jgi:hypothetical protein
LRARIEFGAARVEQHIAEGQHQAAVCGFRLEGIHFRLQRSRLLCLLLTSHFLGFHLARARRQLNPIALGLSRSDTRIVGLGSRPKFRETRGLRGEVSRLIDRFPVMAQGRGFRRLQFLLRLFQIERRILGDVRIRFRGLNRGACRVKRGVRRGGRGAARHRERDADPRH